MNDLSIGQFMTIKEISVALNVSEETVRSNGKKLFPDLFKNGIRTTFSEVQVTAIKLEIQKHHNLQSTLEVTNIKTKLEKALLVKQALQLQEEMINELSEENQKLKTEVEELKPKAIEHDTFMNNESFQKIGDVAKVFGIKPNTLHQMLRDAKILKDNHVPYSEFEHHFKTVEKPTSAGFNVFTSYIKPSGISYITKRFNLQRSA